VERIYVAGTIRDCCKDAANLVPVPSETDESAGMTTRECRVCGRRHRRLRLDPARVRIMARPRQTAGVNG